jgi:hypothetical protein
MAGNGFRQILRVDRAALANRGVLRLCLAVVFQAFLEKGRVIARRDPRQQERRSSLVCSSWLRKLRRHRGEETHQTLRIHVFFMEIARCIALAMKRPAEKRANLFSGWMAACATSPLFPVHPRERGAFFMRGEIFHVPRRKP